MLYLQADMKKSFLIILFLMPFLCCQAGNVRRYRAVAVRDYPHDENSYTQGLFFLDGQMYESTGQYGSSTFRKVDLESGKALRRFDFKKKYFVEGSCALDGKIFILTWTSKVAFVYDAGSLEYETSYSYPREGWGLTTDGESLVASDGSSTLFFMDKDFKLKKSLKVTMDGRPVAYLNELEYIDGKIWANVYMTDLIVAIDPENGNVVFTVDCTGLLPDSLRDERTDVLNGIAFNPTDGRIYLTGKYWKKLYEIKLEEKKD